MNKGIFAAFDQRQEQVQRFVSGCNSQYGMPCSCGPDCQCTNCDKSCQQNKEAAAVAAMAAGAVDPQTMLQQIRDQRMALEHQQQARTTGSTPNGLQLTHGGPDGGGLSPGVVPQDVAQFMGGGGAAALPGQQGSVKAHGRMSIASEAETFGRAMSGLSALSIDWENMDDFDVNVDHSAHINSDIAGGAPPIGVVIGDAASGSVDNGITEGCAMATGGACTCGPSCVCVGCPMHDQSTSLRNFATAGTGGPRRSSMRKGSQMSGASAAAAAADADATGGDQAVSFKI